MMAAGFALGVAFSIIVGGAFTGVALWAALTDQPDDDYEGH